MGITHYTWDASYKKASPLQISSRKGHRTYAISEAHTEKSQMLYKMPLGVCSDDEHQRVCSLADGGQEAMKEWGRAVGFPLMPDLVWDPPTDGKVSCAGGAVGMGQDVTERGRTKHEQLWLVRWNEEKSEHHQSLTFWGKANRTFDLKNAIRWCVAIFTSPARLIEYQDWSKRGGDPKVGWWLNHWFSSMKPTWICMKHWYKIRFFIRGNGIEIKTSTDVVQFGELHTTLN